MEKLLEVNSLSVLYDGRKKALHNISMDVGYNEVVAIVGESGCGKSTLIKTIFNLLPKNAAIESGEVIFNGQNMNALQAEQWRGIRGNDIAMIFQNPGSYMNPVMRIGNQFIESIRTHRKLSKAEAAELAENALEKMNLQEPDRIMRSYPFQLSGGMKQRVAISMALAMEPMLILADEPTSALDVVTQLKIMDECKALQQEVQSSIIWITHNIGTAAYMADRIIVMNNGEVVEAGNTHEVIHHPKMEYTKKLLDSIPRLKGVLT